MLFKGILSCAETRRLQTSDNGVPTAAEFGKNVFTERTACDRTSLSNSKRDSIASAALRGTRLSRGKNFPGIFRGCC